MSHTNNITKVEKLYNPYIYKKDMSLTNNTLNIRQLKSIAKERGLKRYSRLRKFELVNMLNDAPGVSMSIKKDLIDFNTPAAKWKILPIKRRKKMEFDDSRLQKPITPSNKINSKINRMWNKFIDLVPEPIKNKATEVFTSFKNKINDLYKQHYIKPETRQYNIHKVDESYNQKFHTWFDEYQVELSKTTVDIDPVKVFMEILNKVKEERGLLDGDKIRLIISHNTWRSPYSTGLLNVNNCLEDMMANKIGQFVEYKEVPLSEVKIEVQSFKIPRGRGRLHVAKNTIARKNCIITIKNDDSICLARAIVTATANINKTKWSKSQIKNGFNDSRKLQKAEALKLHEESGVDVNNFGSTLEDVKKFAAYLGVQINIIDGDQFNELIYSSDVADEMVYLYKNNNHYDVITSMPAFLCKDYYCHSCKKSYAHRDRHLCPSKCLACFKYFPDGIKCSGNEIKCNECNRSFFGKSCYNEHKRERGINDSVCKKVCRCLNCKRTLNNWSKRPYMWT